jgi:hypothetical protein
VGGKTGLPMIRIAFLLLVSISLSTGGEAPAKTNRLESAFIFFQSSTNWLSIQELETIASNHLTKNYTNFAYAEAGKSAYIHQRDSGLMFRFVFFRGLGDYAWAVDLDSAGKVITSYEGFGIDRVTTKDKVILPDEKAFQNKPSNRIGP